MKDSQRNLLSVINDVNLARDVHQLLDSDWQYTHYNDITSVVKQAKERDADIILCEHRLISTHQQLMLLATYARDISARLVVLGTQCTVAQQVKLLSLGVSGYFDIRLALTTLPVALAAVTRGEVWVERQVITALIEQVMTLSTMDKQCQEKLALLSPKEKQVAKLVCQGKSNKSIAYDLTITERTVKAHLTAIFHKTGVSDRLSLAIFLKELL